MKKNKMFIDLDKETSWLNEMSKQGYQLSNIKGNIYHFDENNDTVHYQIDLSEKAGEVVDKSSEIKAKLVCTSGVKSYYSKPIEEGDFFISINPNYKKKYYNSMLTPYVVLLVIFTAIYVPLISKGDFFRETPIIRYIGFGIIFVLFTVVVTIIIRIANLSKDVENKYL